MIKNVVEPFNADVIKVTIKDKPNLYQPNVEVCLKKVFEALRQYVHQERKIRKVSSQINERIKQRRLRYFFKTWYDHFLKTRKISERVIKENKISYDKKIERLINAILEEQKEKDPNSKKVKCQKRIIKKKISPESINKAETNKDKSTNRRTNERNEIAEAPAQNRLANHTKIIEEQRAKLAEQSQFIEINKNTKQMSMQTVNKVNPVLNTRDKKTKRSLIHLMKEQGCRNKSIIEIPRILSPPRFLIRMEIRDEARKQRMKLNSEILQLKREEQKKKEEINLQQIEEKERQEQIEALKEARRIRREQESRRLREMRNNKKLELLAENFYKKYLFKRYIVKPLSILVENKNQRLKYANQYYEAMLLMKVFTAWKNNWIDQQNEKLQLAKKFYRYNLLWDAFSDWRYLVLNIKTKYQVALDFYDMKIQAKCIKAWHLLNVRIHAIIHEKELQAKKHYEKKLKSIYFNVWKKYMLIVDDLKDRAKRRSEWRKLIKKFIPKTSKQSNGSYF